MVKRFLASLTRISDLAEQPYETGVLARSGWSDGDYVVCEVIGKPSALYRIELASGRRTPVLPGQQVVGALGRRAATHDCCGDWRAIGDDLTLNQLTGAGLFGKATSVSRWSGRPMDLRYVGHVLRGGEKVTVGEFGIAGGGKPFSLPSIAVVGTSMSAGKTLTSRTIIAALSGLGYRVAAAKLTGAAGYKDALGYGDAGAAQFVDYVDAGLTDTLGSPDDVSAALSRLLSHVGVKGSDVLVAEIGASPLEAYNGEAALDCLGNNIRMMALVANDAYAARGFQETVAYRPDFVAGPAANTTSSRALVASLTGLRAIDLGGDDGVADLTDLLKACLT